jgi:hypothetical protein
MTPRMKIVALTYLVKTLIVGVAWISIPDLPERAVAKAREIWSTVARSDR